MGILSKLHYALDYCEFTHFRTSKTAQIHDWRLALCYWLMVAGAIVYFFWNLYSSQSYLVSVVPVGSTSHWASSAKPSDLHFDNNGKCTGACGQATGYYDALEKMQNWTDLKGGSFAYCNTPSYDFHYSAEWVYGPFECGFNHHSTVWKKEIDHMYFTTAVEQTKMKCFAAPSGVSGSSACKSHALTAGLSCASASHFGTTCCCSQTGYSFNAAVEHLAVEVDHSFGSMYEHAVATGKGERPKTIFRDQACATEKGTSDTSCHLATFEEGTLISVPVGKLLTMAGVDLEADACEQPGGSNRLRVNGACPKTRLTGVQLELQMAYYNFNLHSGGILFTQEPPLCIVDVAPKVMWNSLGSDVSVNYEPSWAKTAPSLQGTFETVDDYRYGITVHFKNGSGKIGMFDFFSFVNTLLQVVVLMGLATTVTTYLARFAMGRASTAYEGAINERLSFMRELARFACQTLVGNKVMESIDMDGDGTIDEAELGKALRSILVKWFSAEEVDECNSALFDLFDRRQHRSSVGANMSAIAAEPGKVRTLEIADLIDALTDDRITIDVLRDIMKTKVTKRKATTTLLSAGVMTSSSVRELINRSNKDNVESSYSSSSKEIEGADDAVGNTKSIT